MFPKTSIIEYTLSILTPILFPALITLHLPLAPWIAVFLPALLIYLSRPGKHLRAVLLLVISITFGAAEMTRSCSPDYGGSVENKGCTSSKSALGVNLGLAGLAGLAVLRRVLGMGGS